MKKRRTIIVCLFACFLMLMIPTINAMEYTTIENNTPTIEPEFNEDELKEAILERIEQLKQQEKDNTITGLNWTDPDGPLEGGLDDYSDFISLLGGLITTSGLFYIISQGYFKNPEKLLGYIGNLIVYGEYTFFSLTYFGEAFDIYDAPPSDGR